MRETSSTVDIDASPDTVWKLIGDPENFPTFDPTCVRVLGPAPREGGRLKVYSTLSPDRPFKVRVTTFSPPRRMAWSGGMPFGLLRGVRSFALDPLGGNRTRFTLTETVSGPMLALIQRSLPDMQGAFDGFCRGLRELAEAIRPPSASAR